MIERLPEHEDVRGEFKETWSETAKKTLIAFANTLGVNLYFGVTDDATAKGLSKKEVDMISRSVLQFCRTGTEPVMTDLVSTEVITTGTGNYLLRVSVEPGEDRPYALKGKRYTGGAYVRDGSMSVTSNEEEIRDMIRDSAPEPWESRLSREADLTFGETSDIFRKYHVAFSPAHYLRLGLVDDAGHYTQLGELLSDQNQRKLVIGTFSQDEASLSVREFSGSLLRQIDQGFDLFAAMNPELIQKTEKLSNKRQFAWPPKVLREALVNCTVHRDYSQPEPTKVSIFPNRFEFLFYGCIPGRLSVDDIVNKTLRGKGYGSRLLRDFIAASAKRVLLEIDPVTDYVSAARLRFYKHCGLTENPYEHRHPPYRPEFKAHPLVVLTTEGTMTEESYLRFYRELRAVVMALPDVPGA